MISLSQKPHCETKQEKNKNKNEKEKYEILVFTKQQIVRALAS